MRLHSEFFSLSGALLAVSLLAGLAGPALAASSQQSPVYTWVDGNGVRHYADHPGSPKAHLVSLKVVPGETHAGPAAASTGHGPGKARVPRTVPTPAAATANAKKRQAQCTTLKRQLSELKSARRVRVTQNGKTRTVQGENLVKFRKQVKQRMQQVCQPPSS